VKEQDRAIETGGLFMDRIEKSKEKYKQLFGDGVPAAYATDPDFQDILSRFIFGEVFYQGNLDDKKRELITLVVLAANQTLPQLKAHCHVALNVGLTPIEIKEAVYQCAPYLGFPKTLNAIAEINEVFKARNIALPIESQKQVEEDNRFDKGLAVQVEIFGDVIVKNRGNAPSNQKHIQDYLHCLPYMGFPRTLNALNCVNEIIPE
jgi:4-carboxymuconolactone decarboxylase